MQQSQMGVELVIQMAYWTGLYGLASGLNFWLDKSLEVVANLSIWLIAIDQGQSA